MFEKVSRSLRYDSNIFLVHNHISKKVINPTRGLYVVNTSRYKRVKPNWQGFIPITISASSGRPPLLGDHFLSDLRVVSEKTTVPLVSRFIFPLPCIASKDNDDV